VELVEIEEIEFWWSFPITPQFYNFRYWIYWHRSCFFL